MKNITNSDKILHIIMNDPSFLNYLKEWDFDQSDFRTIDNALASEHPIVVAVAKIISGSERKYSEKEIYKEVNSYLKSKL